MHMGIGVVSNKHGQTLIRATIIFTNWLMEADLQELTSHNQSIKSISIDIRDSSVRSAP